MKCRHCEQDLYISKCTPVSNTGTTVVKMSLTLVCTNQDCIIYCGPDTKNPKHVADNLVLNVSKEE